MPDITKTRTDLIERAGPDVRISWPAAYADWNVYTAPSATANAWTPLGTIPVSVSGRLVVTISPSGETQFFRVGRP